MSSIIQKTWLFTWTKCDEMKRCGKRSQPNTLYKFSSAPCSGRKFKILYYPVLEISINPILNANHWCWRIQQLTAILWWPGLSMKLPGHFCNGTSSCDSNTTPEPSSPSSALCKEVSAWGSVDRVRVFHVFDANTCHSQYVSMCYTFKFNTQHFFRLHYPHLPNTQRQREGDRESGQVSPVQHHYP